MAANVSGSRRASFNVGNITEIDTDSSLIEPLVVSVAFIFYVDNDTRALPANQRHALDPVIEPNQRREQPFRTLEGKQEWIDAEACKAKSPMPFEKTSILSWGIRALSCGPVPGREFQKAPRNAEPIRFNK